MDTNILDLQTLNPDEGREHLEAFLALEKSPGWQILLSYVAAVGNQKTSVVLSPMETGKETLQREGLKGEIRGAYWVTQLPKMFSEELREYLGLEEAEETLPPHFNENPGIVPGREIVDNDD